MALAFQHKAAEGLTIDVILEGWSTIKTVILSEWDENKEFLIDLFGKVRDEWMDNDLGSWIAANRFYPGVPDALQLGRFADALLRNLAGVTIAPKRIFGLGTGSKVEVLKRLQKKPEHQGQRLRQVIAEICRSETRFFFLITVICELYSTKKSSMFANRQSRRFAELDGWDLNLEDWGYNTKEEREEAASTPGIQILRLSGFTTKLK